MEAGLGLLIINQQIRYFLLEPNKASALAGYRICCSNYFKKLDHV